MIHQFLDRIAEAVMPSDENQADLERKAIVKYADKVTTYKETLEKEARYLRERQKKKFVFGSVALTLGAIAMGIAHLFYGVTLLSFPLFAWIGIGIFFFFSMVKLAKSDPMRKVLHFWEGEKDKLDAKLSLIQNGDNRHSWEKGLDRIAEDWDEVSGQFKKLANEHKKARRRMRKMR